MKINDMGGNNLDGMANQTKETLFQKFSIRDNVNGNNGNKQVSLKY